MIFWIQGLLQALGIGEKASKAAKLGQAATAASTVSAKPKVLSGGRSIVPQGAATPSSPVGATSISGVQPTSVPGYSAAPGFFSQIAKKGGPISGIIGGILQTTPPPIPDSGLAALPSPDYSGINSLVFDQIQAKRAERKKKLNAMLGRA